MNDYRGIWEARRAPLPQGNGHFAECAPDLYVPELLDLHADQIANLGVQHVFIDFDGTIAASGNIPPAEESVLEHVRQLAHDPRFETFGVATDNGSRYMGRIAASLGDHVKLYQPIETPKGDVTKASPGFYRRILFETDIWDNPELAVMIGDSPRADILVPQELGMRTILVDRLEMHFAEEYAKRIRRQIGLVE